MSRPGRPAHFAYRRAVHGFTLVELLAAVLILGLLTLIALPSFLEQMRKSRRSEAFNALTAVQQAQERWRGNNESYTTDLDQLKVNAGTPSGYYTISVSAPTAPDTLAVGYLVEATAAGSQAADSRCPKLAVELVRGNLRYGSGTSIDWTDANRCWAR